MDMNAVCVLASENVEAMVAPSSSSHAVPETRLGQVSRKRFTPGHAKTFMQQKRLHFGKHS